MGKHRPTLYIETSVISYLTARPSANIVHQARQQATTMWWRECLKRYDAYVSEVVLNEASSGDNFAAQRRLEVIKSLPVVPMSRKALDLAQSLVTKKIIPPNAAGDAMHLALAMVNKLDFLASWNYRHLANAEVRHKLELWSRRQEIVIPTICTPEELKGK